MVPPQRPPDTRRCSASRPERPATRCYTHRVAIERELKFSTSDDHVPSVPELSLALEGSGMLVVEGRVSRHHDVYYDADGALAAAGVALRRRRRTGAARDDRATTTPDHVVVTLKSDGSVTGALHERSELQWRVGPDLLWPDEVATRVTAVPGVGAMERVRPVVDLRIRRVAFLVAVERDQGRPFAEVAFDEVVASSARQRAAVEPGHEDTSSAASVTFHEVEFEALTDLDGTVARLTAVADAVATVVKLTPSSASKLERAKALLDAIVGS